MRSSRQPLRALVALAADAIAPAWPLDTFVAVNPLGGYETTTFEDATARASALFRARVLPDSPLRGSVATDVDATRRAEQLIDAIGINDTLADACEQLGWGDLVTRINERTSRWLSAYCDRGEAVWPMPHRELGFYRAWKRLARHENAHTFNAGAYRGMVDALPLRADDALQANLEALGIPDVLWIGYLQRHLAQCAGWSAYVKQQTDAGHHMHIDLVALLAVRTWYERLEVGAVARARGCTGTLRDLRAWVSAQPDRVPVGRDAGFDCVAHASAMQQLERREGAFRERLLNRIRRAPTSSSSSIEAQFVFCIDARSEPLRRKIENSGPYETFGFAGFFGVPFRLRAFGAAHAVAQAPVLLRPTSIVDERPGDASACHRSLNRAAARDALADGALSHPIAAFAGVEAFGVFAALRAALRTFLPRRTRRGPLQPLALEGIAADERLFFAEAILKIMGLTAAFAPFVVLCGHGGGSVNNAFGSALDCGACGGNPGLVNARVACAILNDEDVRAALAERGISIPSETVFIAAEHDTTRDVVRFLVDDLPGEQRAAALKIEEDVNVAATQSRAERIVHLPVSPFGRSDARGRADDWAQVRPEWGLARNAGFIVGPRALTRSIDLEGRCFLHSYDPAEDTGGAVLEQILTAPLVVAEWINLHYFFATVDPERFGSGDKVLQQPVGGFGVVLGNGGDLRFGLPRQSTSVGQTPYHEALRLQAVVYAPTSRLDAVIARQSVLQRLFDNRWVSLVAIDPDDGAMRRYAGHHSWLLISPKEAAACSQIA
jgi:uncharacterized protein YbcC (UPF0753/DUF2309 family)